MWLYLITFAFLVVLYKAFATEKIKYYVRFFILLIYPHLISFFVLPLCLFRPRDVRNASSFIWFTAVIFTKLMDIKWTLRNPEILAEERGAIVVANHQSILDSVGLPYFWNVAHKMTVISKTIILYTFLIPLGLTLYLCGVIFIGSSNALQDLKDGAEKMAKEKTKIFIFPEGTRNSKFPKLLPFKKGAFNMAVHTQVPIIPMVYSPYYFVNHQKKFFRNGHAIVECLEPIPTVGLTMEDVPALTEKVHGLMQEAFLRLSKEVLDPLPKDYDCAYKLNE